MDDDEEYDDVSWGLFNSLWMLKSSIYHVSHPYLYHAVCEMVDYLTREEEPEVAKALDVLAQNALSGHYHDPFDDEEPDVERLSEEEIDEQVKQFHSVLRGVPVLKNKKKDPNEEENNNGDS